MASLRLEHVAKRYGNTTVIHGVDLEVADGEFVVFVGPSGCGKSTLLRMIAGLESVTDGNLVIGGRRVNDVSAAQRGLAMVFQSYALYPHMTVSAEPRVRPREPAHARHARSPPRSRRPPRC